jgi:branched-chain amino acid transport system ATP-binding protein
MTFLELEHVSKSFGKLQAVLEVDLRVEKGEIHSLIGPNGAGKSTLFNVITGYYAPKAGRIEFDGLSLVGLKPHEVARAGIGRSFQQNYLFMGSTVLENVLTGCHLRESCNALKTFLHSPGARRAGRQAITEALELIEFMGLGTQKNELAGNLAHGHQRALGVTIALASRPRLLLLDEPLTCMNPTETEEMMGRIRKIRDSGVTMIMVEHSMRAVMKVSDRITVLNYGRKIVEGVPTEIQQNDQVIEAYLGKEADQDASRD